MSGVRPSHCPPYIAVVAQLVRVSACHAEGRGFEPRQPRHILEISSIGRAPVFGTVGSRFESWISSQFADVTQLVRVSAFQAECRQFEPGRPLQFLARSSIG